MLKFKFVIISVSQCDVNFTREIRLHDKPNMTLGNYHFRKSEIKPNAKINITLNSLNFHTILA